MKKNNLARRKSIYSMVYMVVYMALFVGTMAIFSSFNAKNTRLVAGTSRLLTLSC